ncbi:transposase [Bacillus smithii]|uniref:transposase n=1 Tax=Bacillus smithii TaxID=1479 RepID=UPI003D25E5BA
MKKIIRKQYSERTISHTTNVIKEEIKTWSTRPLNMRDSVSYFDGLYVKLRRDTVEIFYSDCYVC